MPDKIAQIGRQAARAAGEVMRRNYQQPHQITMKGAIDPVTETDYQCQEIIMGLIRQAFPDHGFLAEEGEAGQAFPAVSETGHTGLAWEAEAAPGCRWIIDPLDGTVNFAHGFPAFCVSIALEADGVLIYGVIYDPLRDELFEAKRGAGASLNGRPIRVSSTSRLERALIATGFPYDIRERVPETMARLGRVLAVTQGVRRAGSAALDLGYVACGRLDGFYEENLKPWDTAAGLLIVAEAGGEITTFDGGDYDLYSPNILASNGLLHKMLLSCLKGDGTRAARPVPGLPDTPFYVGVDGCGAGWFAIALGRDGKWQTQLFPNIAELWETYKAADLILVDIPIGLKEDGYQERRCDKQARALLGPPRASSVFRVPCRQAVYVANYNDASQINEQLTETRLSPMTWGIIRKIREVDKFIGKNRSAIANMKEIHPEICFWAFAGQPMQHNKKRSEGFDERLHVLKSHYPETAAIVSFALKNYRKKDVAKDDILDALAAAVTALPGGAVLKSLPDQSEFDELRLPMQMLYRKANSG